MKKGKHTKNSKNEKHAKTYETAKFTRKYERTNSKKIIQTLTNTHTKAHKKQKLTKMETAHKPMKYIEKCARKTLEIPQKTHEDRRRNSNNWSRREPKCTQTQQKKERHTMLHTPAHKQKLTQTTHSPQHTHRSHTHTHTHSPRNMRVGPLHFELGPICAVLRRIMRFFSTHKPLHPCHCVQSN